MVLELILVKSPSSCEEEDDQKDRDGCVVGWWCESDGYDGGESLKLLLEKLKQRL